MSHEDWQIVPYDPQISPLEVEVAVDIPTYMLSPIVTPVYDGAHNGAFVIGMVSFDQNLMVMPQHRYRRPDHFSSALAALAPQIQPANDFIYHISVDNLYGNKCGPLIDCLEHQQCTGECGVCYSSVESVIQCCKQHICKGCVKKWSLRLENTCPFCRRVFLRAQSNE